jgi:hypothetical protein
VTYYVLFFIHLESRRVYVAGVTVHPNEAWMKQIARNATMEDCGALRDCRYLLHDRDTKSTRSFRAIVASGEVEPLALPARSPNLNAYAERWVRSVKEECLSRVILFGERSLRRALSNYVDHFHAERNHQGKGNVLLFPQATARRREGPVRCRQRLGGLLRYYHREAACWRGGRSSFLALRDHVATDLKIDLIQVPVRVGLGSAPTQVRRDHRPEMVYPAANGFVGDRNAAFCQQVFDVAQAQGEPKV